MLNIADIAIPECYMESSDFRFFVDLIKECLEEVKTDIENMMDNYDPLKIKEELLWILGEHLGYKLDDRLPTAFNRLVILYFLSMIKLKGSKDGITLAAEVNLAQFNILDYGKEKDILYNRLEDTSIPVNSVNVTPHTDSGYIDLTYFSTKLPVDACIEYVRPLGMYVFARPGVRVDARSKISIDAKLTDENYVGMSIGPTRVGHYSREDYARLQKMFNETKGVVNSRHTRRSTYSRNSDAENRPTINAGYRALHSIQLCNNEHIVRSVLPDPIFSIGYGPQDVETIYGETSLRSKEDKPWNLLLDRDAEKNATPDVYTAEPERTTDDVHPRPAVNPIMGKIGDAISLNKPNTKYTKVTDEGIKVVDQPDE